MKFRIISTGKRGETNGHISKRGSECYYCGDVIELSAEERSAIPKYVILEPLASGNMAIGKTKEKWWHWLLPWKWFKK